RLEVGLRHGGGQIDVGVCDRVEQRADQLCAADGGAALRADVGGEPIEKHDLAVEQHDGDLGPGFVMHRRAARSAALLRASPGARWGENVLTGLARLPLAAGARHGFSEICRSFRPSLNTVYIE